MEGIRLNQYEKEINNINEQIATLPDVEQLAILHEIIVIRLLRRKIIINMLMKNTIFVITNRRLLKVKKNVFR